MSKYIEFDNNIKIEKEKLKNILIKIQNEVNNNKLKNIKIFFNKKNKENSINEKDFLNLLNTYINKNLIFNRKNKIIFNNFLVEEKIKIDLFKNKVYFNSFPRTRNTKYLNKNKKIKNKIDKELLVDNKLSTDIDINYNKQKSNKRYIELLNDIKNATEEIDSDFEIKNINTKEKEQLLKELETVFFNPFENKKLSIIIGIVIGIIIAIIAKFFI